MKIEDLSNDKTTNTNKPIGEYTNLKSPIKDFKKFDKLPATVEEMREVFSIVYEIAHNTYGGNGRDALDKAFRDVSDGINPIELERTCRQIMARIARKPQSTVGRACVNCGTEFQARRDNERFCSKRCGGKYRRQEQKGIVPNHFSENAKVKQRINPSNTIENIASLAERQGIDPDELTEVLLRWAVAQYKLGNVPIKIVKTITLEI